MTAIPTVCQATTLSIGGSVPSLSLATEGQTISGVQFDLAWDNNLDVHVTPAGQLGPSGKTLYAALLQPNVLRCLITGVNGNTLSDGDLLRIYAGSGNGSDNGGQQVSVLNAIAVTAAGDAVPLVAISASPFSVPSAGQVSTPSVVNAASLMPGPVSPGEIITILGVSGINGNDPNPPVISINGTSATVLYSGTDQINAVIPFGLDITQPATLTITSLGNLIGQATLATAALSPAIFTQNATGLGLGAILNQDSTLNTFDNPADPGSIIMVYGTGFGLFSTGLTDGQPAPGPDDTATPISASIDGIPAQVVYAGAAPGLIAGLAQVNIVIPKAAAHRANAQVVLNGGPISTPQGPIISIR